MELVIEIENVFKEYNMKKAGILTVLKNVNLDIKKGEFVAITGPSGSGKSTMMNIVGALDVPTKGEVKLNGRPISKMKESELAVLRGQTIGFIFQQFNLLPTLSALKNVMLPMEMSGKSTKYAEERAKKLLTMLGLEERFNHKPYELSGGQQQRVAIARSLANEPEVVLADEPTGNLDSKTGQFVMEFLKKINNEQKTTVVLITHDPKLVCYADRIVHIMDGQISKIENNIKTSLKGGATICK